MTQPKTRAQRHRAPRGVFRGLHRAAACAFVLATSLVSHAAASSDDAGWTQLDDDGFAKIESRPIDGTKVHETRVTATLKWPARRLIALVGDVVHYPSFMPPTEKAQALQQEAHAGRYYIVIDPPVIHRRDYCVGINIVRMRDGRLQSRFRRAPEGCPAEQGGLVRMTRVEGSWTLTPLPDGGTKIVYQAITDPAGTVPTWMVNRAAGDSVRDMFHALDKAAGNPSVSACPASGSIGCGF